MAPLSLLDLLHLGPSKSAWLWKSQFTEQVFPWWIPSSFSGPDWLSCQTSEVFGISACGFLSLNMQGSVPENIGLPEEKHQAFSQLSFFPSHRLQANFLLFFFFLLFVGMCVIGPFPRPWQWHLFMVDLIVGGCGYSWQCSFF